MYEQLDLTGIAAADEAIELEPVSDRDIAQEPESSIPPSKATTGRTIEIVVGYRDLDKLHAMIQPISTRLTKEQAGLSLPPKLYTRRVFEMAPEQRHIYDQLRREFMVELDGGKLITAAITMVRVTRLQQVACGYLPDPDDPVARRRSRSRGSRIRGSRRSRTGSRISGARALLYGRVFHTTLI